MNSYFIRSTGFFALLLVVMIGLLACESETITIERTEDGAVVRTDGPTAPVTQAPIATPPPGEPVVFPPGSDGAALVAVYDAASGDSWSNSDGWIYTVDIGQWHGVTVDAAGRVTALDLSGNGLSGDLPEEIGTLTALMELDLSENSINGPLPAEIGSLTNLEELYLNNNQLSGALPTGIAALTALTDLHLDNNQFGAEFPPALANLTNLESVTIWNNKFTWADSYAPGLLADMVGLVALYESAGGGNWRDRSGWLSDPSVAAWSGVSIDGDGRVTGLDLSERGLSGELPAALGSLTSLAELHLHSNQLGGDIPSTLGNLTNLEELTLNDNQLGGELAAELSKLTGLTKLHLHSNQLGGNLPAGLGSFSGLAELSVHSNRLSGPIPADLGNLGKLTELWLHDNQFSGEFPSELTNLSGLKRVSLFGNRFTWAETYSPGILADMVGLVVLYESTDGENWANRSNWATITPVGEWHGVTVGAGGLVTELELSDNGLNGELPPQLGSLSNLEHLGLWRNQLTGSIPPELGDLNKLEVLGIAGNKLTGTIPPELGGLVNLTDLMLDVNGLSGSIPAELGNLANLKELWLNENQLSGVVPAELGQLSNLTTLRIENNNLEGEFPSEIGNLANLQHASIWDNKLTWAGSYANGYLSDMVALVALHDSALAHSPAWREAGGNHWLRYAPLDQWGDPITVAGGRVTGLNLKNYRQHVSGEIPPELALLTGLEKLDLSDNPGLGGELPATIGNLMNLEKLHIYNTSIKGRYRPS